MATSLNFQRQKFNLQDVLQHFRSAYKTFQYHQKDINCHFFIDKIEGQSGYYQMTSQGSRVMLGDYIEIVKSEHTDKYQVTEVEYYCEPSDMWIAVLHRI